MTAFLDIKEVLSVGRAGFLARTRENDAGKVIVRQLDVATNSALGVCDGTTPGKTAKIPGTALEAKRLRGILLDPEFRNDFRTATDYLANDPGSIVEEGFVWVNAEGTVAIGDDVYVRFVTDGGSNTTPGTFRADCDTPTGGIRITPSALTVTANGVYSVTLRNKAGAQESFSVFTDGTATPTEIATALKNQVDQSPNFDAVDNTGSFNVTVQGGGAGQVEVIALSEHLTLTIGNRAERVDRAEWASAVTGAGLAMIRLYESPFQKKVA